MQDNTIRFNGSIWPNGRFGLSRQKKKALDPFHREYPHPRQSLQECEERIQNYNNYLATGEVSPLGLSNVANSHSEIQTRASRGSNGITSYGRNMVESGAFLLQRRYGQSRLSFLTLTVPTLSDAEMSDICRNWSEIIRVLLQRLSRFLERNDLPKEIIGVTEVQELRSAAESRACLHIHWVFVGRHPGDHWVLSPELIRSWWRECLSKWILEPETVDWRAVENIERVKKDAAAYLGKYMSKGKKSAKNLSEKMPNYPHPSAWWNCTKNLKALINSRKIKLSGNVAIAFVDTLEDRSDPGFIWVQSISIPHEIFGSIGVGYCGRISIASVIQWRNIADIERECLSTDGHSLIVNEQK